MANEGATTELILYDEYISDAKSYLVAAALDANRKLDILIETLKKVCSESVVEGETAKALKEFSDRTAQLSGLIYEYGTECVNLINEFFETIDDIDGNLY